MFLQQRIDLLVRLGKYLDENPSAWATARLKAERENPWFTPEFQDKAVRQICQSYLQPEGLEAFAGAYGLPPAQAHPKKVGLVMAGNIPLVGFHDLLCGFLSGHRLLIKPSSRDNVLVRHLVETLSGWEPAIGEWLAFSERLNGCDAYIATGSNNTARYFEYYFGKYPHIIRRNRTSVAVLSGLESRQELEALADDVYLYFGRGCRNVTKLLVPEGYDFVGLLDAFGKYQHLADHHKYKNNYDYYLAIYILNRAFYMTNGSILLMENGAVFAPISQLNYEFYRPGEDLLPALLNNTDIQCVVGEGAVPMGRAQFPALDDFADGADTLAFLAGL